MTRGGINSNMSKRKLSNLARRQASLARVQGGVSSWVRDQFVRMVRLNQGLVGMSVGR